MRAIRNSFSSPFAAALVLAALSSPSVAVDLIAEIPDFEIAQGETVHLSLDEHFTAVGGGVTEYDVTVTTTHQITGQQKTGKLNEIAVNKLTGVLSAHTLSLTGGNAVPQPLALEITAIDGNGFSASDTVAVELVRPDSTVSFELAEGERIAIDVATRVNCPTCEFSAQINTLNYNTGQRRTGALNSVARNKVTGWFDDDGVLTLIAGPARPQDIGLTVTGTAEGADPVTLELHMALVEETALAQVSAMVGEHETVDAFLGGLPYEHKANALYMQASQGLFKESVSARTPRVISWGATADTILSWGSNAEADSHDTVEFIQFDKRGWRLGVVDFDESPPTLTDRTDQCAACHAGNKPLWASYRTWPGMVGSMVKRLDYRNSGNPRLAFPTERSTDPVKMFFAGDEFAVALATRQAELLWHGMAPSLADDIVCHGDYRPNYLTQWFAAEDAILSVMRDPATGKLRDVNPNSGDFGVWPKNKRYDSGRGTVASAMSLLITKHAVESGNTAVESWLEDNPNTTGMHPAERWELHFPGGGTMLDEVNSAYKLLFGTKGADHFTYRREVNGRVVPGGDWNNKATATTVRNFRQWSQGVCSRL